MGIHNEAVPDEGQVYWLIFLFIDFRRKPYPPVLPLRFVVMTPLLYLRFHNLNTKISWESAHTLALIASFPQPTTFYPMDW